jgi:predicted membrane protein
MFPGEQMHPVISKTFGGLSTRYYIRHFIFGLAFPIFIFLMVNQGNRPIQVSMWLLFLVNTLLYPYSRFVYESIVGFIVGENVFFVNAVLMLAVKVVTMALCWALAIFIAPLGLAYLYIHHSRAA